MASAPGLKILKAIENYSCTGSTGLGCRIPISALLDSTAAESKESNHHIVDWVAQLIFPASLLSSSNSQRVAFQVQSASAVLRAAEHPAAAVA